jgi:hypothetical protein
MPTTSNSSSTADCRAVCEDVLKSNKNDFVDAEAMAEAIELVEVIPAQDPKPRSLQCVLSLQSSTTLVPIP